MPNSKRSGTQMYYETMGHGDPVILIHQCWWNNFEYEGVIPMIAKEYTVYSPDSLGFGFSPAAPQWFEFTDFTDSFVDFMDALGIEKASFVGQHSEFSALWQTSRPDIPKELTNSSLEVLQSMRTVCASRRQQEET